MKKEEKTENLGIILEEVKSNILSGDLADINDINFILYAIIKKLLTIVKRDKNIYKIIKETDKFEAQTKINIINIGNLIQEIENFIEKSNFQQEILKKLEKDLNKIKRQNNPLTYILIIDILIDIVELEDNKTERFESCMNPNSYENWKNKHINADIDNALYEEAKKNIEKRLVKIK